jgi:hypothetical protein
MPSFRMATDVRAGTVRASAGAVSLADRLSDAWIDVTKVKELELLSGKAALNALVSTSVEDYQHVTIDGSSSIWAD